MINWRETRKWETIDWFSCIDDDFSEKKIIDKTNDDLLGSLRSGFVCNRSRSLRISRNWSEEAKKKRVKWKENNSIVPIGDENPSWVIECRWNFLKGYHHFGKNWKSWFNFSLDKFILNPSKVISTVMSLFLVFLCWIRLLHASPARSRWKEPQSSWILHFNAL